MDLAKNLALLNEGEKKNIGWIVGDEKENCLLSG